MTIFYNRIHRFTHYYHPRTYSKVILYRQTIEKLKKKLVQNLKSITLKIKIMKTKILILAVLVATSMTLVLATSNLENNFRYANCRSQILNALESKLIMTRDMNETSANVFVKINENGQVMDIRVFYPDKQIAQEIKKIIEKERFDLKKDIAGIYKLNVKFSVR